MTEKELQNQVMAWLHQKGVMCWPNAAVSVYDPQRKRFRKSHNRFHRNGIPDILGVLPGGLFLGIELKKPPTGKRKEETLFNMLSDDQKSFLADCRTNGGVCFVADSLETVIKNVEPLLAHNIYPKNQSDSIH